MAHCFMTGRPPKCSDSTDVPVVPSVGKLQTTLQSHAGRSSDCADDDRLVFHPAAAAASRLLQHSLPQATPSFPTPRRRRLSPAAGALT